MKNKILNAIKAMDDSEIIRLWNEFVYDTNRYDDEILDAYQLEEWLSNSNGDTISILNRFYFGSDDMNPEGSANPNRNYFTFNGYGNIISFDYIYNEYTNEFYHIDIDDLVNYIIENNESFYNDEISEILEAIED